MRRKAASLAVLAALMLAPAPAAVAEPPEPAPVRAYTSTWAETGRSVSEVGRYVEGLVQLRSQYTSSQRKSRADLAEFSGRAEDLQNQIDALKLKRSELDSDLDRLSGLVMAQERRVGGMIRSVYQAPGASLIAFERIMDGASLSALDPRYDYESVVGRAVGELDAQKVRRDRARDDKLEVQRRIDAARELRDEAAALAQRAKSRLEAASAGLKESGADLKAARAALVKLVAAQQASLGSLNVSAGVPSGADVPADLPADVPFKDVFIQMGTAFGVDPALLAAIAAQESGFDPDAGCYKSFGGQGIMQHEGQAQYCGIEQVPASIARSAAMLAGYFQASRSWSAAVFAYNNGPGLMDEWVANEDNPDRLIAVLTKFYDAQPYAIGGPYQGYASWGAWRARVAFSYASAEPVGGFHSVVVRWLEYRRG